MSKPARPETPKSVVPETGGETARRDAARGYTDADLAEVADNPEWTSEMVAKARPFAEVFPDLAAGLPARRGRQKQPTKVHLNLRLDRAVIDHFKAGGRGWQVRMNDALRRAAGL